MWIIYIFILLYVFKWIFVGLWWDSNTFLTITRDTLSCHKSTANQYWTTGSKCIVHPDDCLFDATKEQSKPLTALASHALWVLAQSQQVDLHKPTYSRAILWQGVSLLSFIHVFIHLFKKYLLSNYYVPAISWTTNEVWLSWNLQSWGKTDDNN